MEGKEVRFGIANSALFATVTTDASCGAVNGMHDSFTPLGGMVPLINIMLGEVVFGGVGAGLYGIFVFVDSGGVHRRADGRPNAGIPRQEDRILRRQDGHARGAGFDVHDSDVLGDLGGQAVSALPSITQSRARTGCRRFCTPTLRRPATTARRSAGLNANTMWYNTTTGVAQLLGRFFMIIPMLAIAGSLARKKTVPESPGTFPVTGGLFAGLLVSTILIVGALTFFPALSLGPILEHLLMNAGKVF